jgi:hypothetical protein
MMTNGILRDSQHWKSEFMSLGVIIALTFLTVGLLHYRLPARLPYPPYSDQTMYLAAASYFARHFIFFWRSPLYGAWIGVFYLVSGCDPQLCFYLEKFASLVVLSLSVACLGYHLFDIRSGLLMGFWTLNCKYVVLETNGSHALAATLFALSLNCLLLRNQAARIPAALLLMFLSTQVRSEMWVPFLGIVAYLAARSVRKRLSGQGQEFFVTSRMRHYWIICSVIGLGSIMLFNARPSPKEPHRLSEAFAMNFALNYIDRHHLSARNSLTETDWRYIWVNALPGVSRSADAIELDREELHPFTAVRKYPGEMLNHVAYNLRLAAIAFPAAFLAFDRRGLMLLVVLGYLLSLVFFNEPDDRPDKWNSLSREFRHFLLTWSIAICLLVPISLLLRVAARYYIQLIPIQITAATLIIRAALNKIRILASSRPDDEQVR